MLDQTNSPMLTDPLPTNPDDDAPNPFLLDSMDPQATWKTFDPHIIRTTYPAVLPTQIAITTSRARDLSYRTPRPQITQLSTLEDAHPMNDSKHMLEQRNSPMLAEPLPMNPDVDAPHRLLLDSMDPQETWKTFDPHIIRKTYPAIPPHRIAINHSRARDLSYRAPRPQIKQLSTLEDAHPLNDSKPTLEQTNLPPLLPDPLPMNPDDDAPHPLLLDSMDPQATWQTFDPHIETKQNETTTATPAPATQRGILKWTEHWTTFRPQPKRTEHWKTFRPKPKRLAQ
jgi:hypothetical protein